MPRALLNFQHRKTWTCHFVAADAKSTIGTRTRFFTFATEPELRAFVLRCTPDDIAHYDHCISAWSRGSAWVNLTDAQYAKLQQ